MSRQDYHLRQYDEKYRSTDSFIEFVDASQDLDRASVIDVGCGAGANIHWFEQAFPRWEFTGVDIDSELLDIARERHDDATFTEVGLESIRDEFGRDTFDYVFSTQFISFIDASLTEFIDICCEVASEGVFFTSLFTDGWIEQETVAKNLDDGWEGTYIVYSLPRPEELLRERLPEADLQYRPFEIDVDLPKPDEPKFQTYTVTLDNGDRLQVSGYMLLPWYELYIDLP